MRFSDVAASVSNAGRWGLDDERGTLNLITPDKVRAAAACVRTGEAFCLALPLGPNGPQTGSIPGRINPLRTMTAVNMAFGEAFRTSDDVVVMGLQAATHWDAWSHVSYDNRLYNLHPASSITEHGAARCGIDKAGTIVSRGVLLDLAPGSRLDPGHEVTPDDLLAAGGDIVEPGDIVLLRTGHLQLFLEGNRRGYVAPAPGPGIDCAVWFRQRDVAAVATDTMTFEVFPCKTDEVMFPVHLLHLVEMGMLQGQNWNLEELARACASDGRNTFFLEATPEPFDRAVGAPVAPVAIR